MQVIRKCVEKRNKNIGRWRERSLHNELHASLNLCSPKHLIHNFNYEIRIFYSPPPSPTNKENDEF
jgi:hypothetical protein